MPHDILALPAFNDNYIWMIIQRESKQAVVVDPGAAQIVRDTLSSLELKLKAVLVTHHHWDHTNGVAELVESYGVPVYGPHQSRYEHALSDNSVVHLESMQLQFHVLAVPGHTLDHLAYYGQQWLFCGDTLFAGGCGRLFEGTAKQLYNSLQHLSKLPPETLVYCAHEYTLRNLEFALHVEPRNNHIIDRLQVVKRLRQADLPSLPSSIEIEHKTNPFLRCEQPDVIAAAEAFSGLKLNDSVAVFTVLRRWKDNF